MGDQSLMAAKPEEVEFEVLPPLSRQAGDHELMRILAYLMDNLIRVPGTNIRFGLDPIMGLLPGLGDSSAAVVSSLILLQSLRAGVPRIVQVRMALNILLNALLGVIPVAGDLFSVWFKSNQRNYELLSKHAGAGRRSTTADWIFVAALIGSVLAVAIGLGALIGFALYRLLTLYR
jgi:hypothetical protein